MYSTDASGKPPVGNDGYLLMSCLVTAQALLSPACDLVLKWTENTSTFQHHISNSICSTVQEKTKSKIHKLSSLQADFLDYINRPEGMN